MERLDRSLDGELRRLGPAAATTALVAAWPGSVGEAIARNAWPARVGRDGALNVTTSSSAWAFELTQHEETILERLREALGDQAPARLRFVPGPVPEAPRESPRQAAPPAIVPGPAERERAVALAAALDDPELRQLVARAAAASLARAAADRAI